MSVVFSGTANYIGFDDVTLGSATPGNAGPEPASLLLLGLGGIAVGIVRRNRHRRVANLTC